MAMKRIWENLIMFDEHTWTDALSVGDPESRETWAVARRGLAPR